MIKRIFKIFSFFLLFIALLAIILIKPLDRTKATNSLYAKKMWKNLDVSLQNLGNQNKSPFQIGFSKISITPNHPVPLAGYGGRRPKTFQSVLDSVYIRTIVLENSNTKIALVNAELLLIHPSVTQKIREKAEKVNWDFDNIFLTATHTHSSIGQWAPGIVGGIISGKYDEKIVDELSEKIIKSITLASKKLKPAKINADKIDANEFIKNRIVGEKGTKDSHIRTLDFFTEKGKILFASYAAHATCFGMDNKKLTGDFPSYFYRTLEKDSNFQFSIYAAGAVASMGYKIEQNLKNSARAQFIGSQLAKKIKTKSINLTQYDSTVSITTFKIPLEIGEPQFKISKNFCVRPYVFKALFGDEKSEISILKINKNLVIGMPCDFSGELALPLYTYAKTKGLNLIITSFNGGYLGYITKDEWYDLSHYETRSMNWYGVGTGKYFSQIVKKIINNYAKE